ncbi:nickel-dependent hydrogenase large subunit [Halochromatium salexigens]|uniref:Ni,Fe-hydrogenase I large subunit n=1 Tax=Halochromatium salexigens TaxID=49447 RepID=A0AAJ0UGD7_HALSE|nr:nickel-dependent hydrogenase large subunit [Halochromatium salexigens]MBK5930097.1 hypothetical protein [Halochromatium salexigens]
MSDLAGQLKIRLDTVSSAVTIHSSRPVTAARVFAGKSPAEVVRQLPTLFSLCGTAQAAACVAACEQALGRQPSAAVLARRQALVHAETIKEHLWRLLLDWPRILAATQARSPAASAMPQVMRAFMALRQAQQAVADPFTVHAQQAEQSTAAVLDPSALLDLVTEQALGTVPDAWLQTLDRPAAVRRWAEQTQTPAAGLVRAVFAQGLFACGANAVARLPEAPWRWLAESLANANADAFIAAPHWQQECAETGPLARVAAQPLIAALLAEYGNGLLTRLMALLVDLAQSARGLEATLDAGMDNPGSAVQLPIKEAGVDAEVDAGVGIGVAEAARGLLVHRVRIAAGRVEQYQILAPTEWNFHPKGVVAQGLAAIARGGAEGPELERLARLYITAVDPCVDYRLSVS